MTSSASDFLLEIPLVRGARAGDTLFCPVSKDKTTLGDVPDDDDCRRDKVSDHLSYTSAAPCAVGPPRPDRTSTVSVRTFSGRLFNFSVALETETVSALKRRVAKAAGVPTERQRLILEDGRCLRGEEALLGEQGIRDGEAIDLFEELRGGGATGEARFESFADVSAKGAMKTTPWSVEKYPKWTWCYPGLVVEGTCKNQYCDARNQEVMMNQRFR